MTWSVRNRLALLAALVLLGTAAGCGDNTPRQTGTGGTGGNSDGSAGAGGAAGTDASGDATTDGDANLGDAHETGGDLTGDKNPDTGEVTGAAGHDGGAGAGGAGADGGAGTGGAGTDGGAGSGGAGTDGGAGTGGAGTDGGAGTGGAGTGGAGTGGSGTGGAGTGGADASADGSAGADGGADLPPEAPPPPACYSVAFVKPIDQGQLSAASDKDGDQCADGFQYDVVINTSAPNGTSVQLFDGAAQLGPPVLASGGTVTFSGVQLASGVNNLAIQFATTAPCTDPTTKAKVTVDCSIPTCSISKPIISPAHPELNGVSTTLGGDRASSDGSPYEVSFQVTTNIADNQIVALDIDNEATPGTITTVTAHALGGTATVAGVPLPGDGTYDVVARCTDGNGVVGRSTKGVYPVDTTPPDLTVSQPSSGAFIGPSGLTAGAFPVCGSTTASDAVNLSAALGTRAANYCVSTTGSPQCTGATVVGANTCVDVPCPGDAPFNITVTISDTAGNPTTTTLTGVTCSSATPTVQIVSPQTDAPTFTNPADHLLAANAGQQLVDLNAGITGAQTNVVACTSRAGTATLSAGLHGGALTQVAAGIPTAPAVAGSGCPAGLGFVVKFMGVTLPESAEDATTGVLTTATEFQVAVTDVSSSTGTATEDLWVDSVAPVISIAGPTGICGSFHQAFATFNADITFTSDTPLVTMTVTGSGSTDTLSSPTFSAGTATFTNVAFDVGQDTLAAVASDPAGNATAVQPVPCTVTVGMAPVVFFTSPMAANELCASTGDVTMGCIDDADPLMAGWQGSLTVQALVGGVPPPPGNITFSVAGSTIGVAPIDTVTGLATLNGVTFLDGDIKITATTDNIPGNGVGSGSVTVTVDLGPPNPPTGLTATVTTRRTLTGSTTMTMNWTAPADFGGGPIAGYQVRYAKQQITAANFDDNAVTTAVTYSGTPSVPGAPDSIDVTGLYIESGYFFAIEAVDAAGNRSPIAATSAAVTAHFNVTVLSSTSGTNEELGYTLSADGDLDGDGISDVVAGTFTGGHAYLYLGAASFAPIGPTTVFSGASNSFGGYGSTVAIIGDVDGDHLDDLAIADGAGNGTVYIYKGRAIWPSTLADTQANYVITADASYSGTLLGNSIAGLGDYTGDGVDDFAFGVPGYNGFSGRVVIVPGKASGAFSGFALAPTSANAIIIDGDAALTTSVFGYRVMGLGHFYSTTSGTTLVASAIGLNPASSANEGRLYSFHGQTGTGGAIAIGTADNLVVGPGKKARIGLSLSNLGPMFGSLPAVGAGNELDALDTSSTGTGYVLHGDATTGPFASRIVMTQSGGVSPGETIFGGGLSGRDVSLSLIGDATPDLVFGSISNTTIDILDGAKLALKTPPVNSKTGEVRVTIPNTDNIAEGAGAIIKDINGDGVPDFALGFGYNAVPGKVRVFW